MRVIKFLQPRLRFRTLELDINISKICKHLYVNTLKRGGGNINKVGKCLPSICLHLEPVMIFAVYLILHILIEQTQDWEIGEMGKCLLTGQCKVRLPVPGIYDDVTLNL